MATFPFVYVNHGVLGAESFGAAASLWIGFARPLTADELQWMIDTCPAPLAGNFYADDSLFYCETPGPETFESAVSRLHGNDTGLVTLPASRDFAMALEQWVREVSSRTRIAFVFGPGTVRNGSFGSHRRSLGGSIQTSAWARWSARQLVAVVEWLEHYLDTHADMPLTEAGAVPDDGWPARPMNRLQLSFIVDSIPAGRDRAYDESDGLDMAERVDMLRADLDYRG